MSAPFLGEIRLVAFNYAPLGWATCDGQILSIAQNTALFALLGTTYGGNGQSTFALPDLRGRVIVDAGQGPGLSNIVQGEAAGTESVTLNTVQMPAHNHELVAHSANATTNDPTAGGFAKPFIAARFQNLYRDGAETHANPQMIETVGSGSGHENRQPHLTLTYIIALEGIFPSR
ncbi:MAG TPA: tail fiber protein [Fimbriimonadaceae bacterium]|nr:tail fiber protein [Fimbriimonadaceae bacterium]